MRVHAGLDIYFERKCSPHARLTTVQHKPSYYHHCPRRVVVIDALPCLSFPSPCCWRTGRVCRGCSKAWALWVMSRKAGATTQTEHRTVGSTPCFSYPPICWQCAESFPRGSAARACETAGCNRWAPRHQQSCSSRIATVNVHDTATHCRRA